MKFKNENDQIVEIAAELFGRTDTHYLNQLAEIIASEKKSRGSSSCHDQTNQKKRLLREVYPQIAMKEADIKQMESEFSQGKARKATLTKATRELNQMYEDFFRLFSWQPDLEIKSRRLVSILSQKDLHLLRSIYSKIDPIDDSIERLYKQSAKKNRDCEPKVLKTLWEKEEKIHFLIKQTEEVLRRYPSYAELEGKYDRLSVSDAINMHSLIEAQKRESMFDDGEEEQAA